MTSDHIGRGSGIACTHQCFLDPHSGFGLGFAVLSSDAPNKLFPTGEYGWDGVAGTFFFVDNEDDLFVVCMMQTPSQRGRIETELKKLIYEALGR